MPVAPLPMLLEFLVASSHRLSRLQLSMFHMRAFPISFDGNYLLRHCAVTKTLLRHRLVHQHQGCVCTRGVSRNSAPNDYNLWSIFCIGDPMARQPLARSTTYCCLAVRPSEAPGTHWTMCGFSHESGYLMISGYGILTRNCESRSPCIARS